MFRFFRFIRQKLLFEGKIPRYLTYAVGEIILVVIGILIALQINNANQQRIENEALWGYMSNIRSNIKNDLKQTTAINFVKDQLAANTPRFWEIRAKEDFSYKDYQDASDHMNTIDDQEAFVPSSFGFETLKSTGYIGKLQGSDMEILLFKYYDLTEKIKSLMDRERAFLDNLVMETQLTDSGITGETEYAMRQDSLVFYQVKDQYIKTLNSPVYDAAVSMFRFNSFFGYRYYLDFLGKNIISLIDAKKLKASPEIMRSVELYDADFSGIGQEEVLINGLIPRSISVYTDSNLGFDQLIVNVEDDHLKFNVSPGLEWAAAMFVVDSLGWNVRPSKDFSEFKSIELEAKGALGNEKLWFTVKDRDDPDDGTEARAALELTKNWKQYKFDLRRDFPTGDLEKLNVLAGFVLLDTEGSMFYIKNIRYLKE